MRISITYQFFILYKFKNIDINIINYIINMSKKVSFENTDNIKYNHTQYDDFIININEDVDNDYYKEDNIIVDNINEDDINEDDINEDDINELNEIDRLKTIESEYYVDLVNIFMIYYNNKYNKSESLLNNIKNDTDTNSQMELFYEYMLELKDLTNILKYESDYKTMNYYFKKEEYINKFNIFTQNYCFEYDLEKIYSPSIIVLLNFGLLNNIDNFNIYTLNNY